MSQDNSENPSEEKKDLKEQKSEEAKEEIKVSDNIILDIDDKTNLENFIEEPQELSTGREFNNFFQPIQTFSPSLEPTQLIQPNISLEQNLSESTTKPQEETNIKYETSIGYNTTKNQYDVTKNQTFQVQDQMSSFSSGLQKIDNSQINSEINPQKRNSDDIFKVNYVDNLNNKKTHSPFERDRKLYDVG